MAQWPVYATWKGPIVMVGLGGIFAEVFQDVALQAAPVDEMQGLGLFAQSDGPVERRVAAAEDHEGFAVEVRRRLDAVMDVAALKCVRPWDAQPPRLKGPDAAGNHDTGGDEPGTGRGGHVKLAVLQLRQFRDFLAEVKRRRERLCLLQQPVDQFLRPANRQRWDIVDRLVRI